MLSCQQAGILVASVFSHFESLLLLKLRRGFLRSEFSLQALVTMTPRRDRKRTTMQSFLGGTTSTCGTSASKTAPHPVTQSASRTPTPPRWTQSGMSTLDSSAPCSSANQVSGWQNEQQLHYLLSAFYKAINIALEFHCREATCLSKC